MRHTPNIRRQVYWTLVVWFCVPFYDKSLRNYKISSFQRYEIILYQRYEFLFERRVLVSLTSRFLPSRMYTPLVPSRLYTPPIILLTYVSPVFACTIVHLPVCLLPYLSIPRKLTTLDYQFE